MIGKVFQFQVVQLKVCSKHIGMILSRISIPGGAIKGVDRDVEKACDNLFQFQVVQLKVDNVCSPRLLPPYFNSRWCN